MATALQPYQGDNSEQQSITRARQALEKRWSTAKIDVLASIITKTRWQANEAPPVGMEKIGMIGAWAEQLEELSPEQLEEYYLRAIKRKQESKPGSTFATNANDIRAEWNRLRDQRRYDEIITDPAKRGQY